MIELRHQQQDPLTDAVAAKIPLHAKVIRQLAEIRLQRRFASGCEVEYDPHEKAGRCRVIILIGFENVAVRPENCGRNLGHDPALIGTRHGEDEFLGHDTFVSNHG